MKVLGACAALLLSSVLPTQSQDRPARFAYSCVVREGGYTAAKLRFEIDVTEPGRMTLASPVFTEVPSINPKSNGVFFPKSSTVLTPSREEGGFELSWSKRGVTGALRMIVQPSGAASVDLIVPPADGRPSEHIQTGWRLLSSPTFGSCRHHFHESSGSL